jgi:hypothetical protein
LLGRFSSPTAAAAAAFLLPAATPAQLPLYSLARCCATAADRVASYISSKAGQDSLSSHVAEVVARKSASEYGDFVTPRSNLTGFTGRHLAAQCCFNS